MIAELRSTVLNSQMPSGAFPSVAHLPGGPVADENAFVTALVLDRLIRLEPDAGIAVAVRRGVEYLLRCENPGAPGAFSFYPPDGHPHWMEEFLPPDADDTALCLLVLFRSGTRSREQSQRQFLQTLDRYRIRRRPRGADWFCPGVYPTWLDSKRMMNPIDLCVNVNVLTFLHTIGLGFAGRGILEMAAAAIDWAGDQPARLASAMPYYPGPVELKYALERANEAGVPGADVLLERLRSIPYHAASDEENAPVCSSLGAGVVWSSPVLFAARAWARSS